MTRDTAPITIDLADLPKSAIDLVERYGMATAVSLIEAWPSIKFPVPVGKQNNLEGARRFAMLAEIVGEAKAEEIVAHCGGTDLYIPSCKTAIRMARNRQIVADYTSGSTVFELAIKYRLSYRSIEMILKTTDTTLADSTAQADLFA